MLEPTLSQAIVNAWDVFRHFVALQQSFNIIARDKTPIITSGISFMRFNRITNCIYTSAFLAAAVVPALAQSPYDGLWNVTIVTNTGSCEPSARYPLTVTDGRVSAPGQDVSGKVGPEGNVRVSIGAAYANGQLSGNTGSGKWNGASGGVPCSGRWEASRQ